MSDEAWERWLFPEPAKPECRGFHWIGQPFTSCDNCGRPWDAHEGYWGHKAGAGPFDADAQELVPWPARREAQQ